MAREEGGWGSGGSITNYTEQLLIWCFHPCVRGRSPLGLSVKVRERRAGRRNGTDGCLPAASSPGCGHANLALGLSSALYVINSQACPRN